MRGEGLGPPPARYAIREREMQRRGRGSEIFGRPIPGP